MAFDRAAHCRRIASSGGKATVEKHGRKHMSEIGKRGFETTTKRYFGGDKEAHKQYLIEELGHAYWKATGLGMKRDASGKRVWKLAAFLVNFGSLWRNMAASAC